LRYIRYIRVGWEVGSCVIIRKATHKWFMSALEINLLMIARYISVQLIIIIIIIQPGRQLLDQFQKDQFQKHCHPNSPSGTDQVFLLTELLFRPL